METLKNSILATLSSINWRAWLPSRGNVLFTLVIVFALFWAQSANALPWQAPSLAATSTGTWPYQGRLADSTGSPITATVPMIFRLYNASTGGTPLWEEQWTGSNSVQVSDGLFNVMLGSLAPIPQSLVGGNSSIWMGITVGTDDEMAPRIQLGSVPFAVQALTVPDGSIGTNKLADGSVTQAKLGANLSFIPPDASITTAKLVDSSITGNKIASGSVSNEKISLSYFASIPLEEDVIITTTPKTISSVTFSTPVDTTCLIMVNVATQTDQAGRVGVSIERNGTFLASTWDSHAIASYGGLSTASYSGVQSCPAGSNTISLSVSTSQGATTGLVRKAEIFVVPFVVAP